MSGNPAQMSDDLTWLREKLRAQLQLDVERHGRFFLLAEHNGYATETFDLDGKRWWSVPVQLCRIVGANAVRLEK